MEQRNGKRPEERTREALEGFRAKMYLKYGAKKCKLIARGVVVALCLVILIAAAVMLVRISSIEVTGDVTMFNESEIIAASGIDEGDGLFWTSSSQIKRNIRQNMPIAQNVKVTKSLFGKVTIKVELLSVDYYTKVGDYYYALDADLRVLDKNKASSKYSAYGAVLVVLPEVREPIVNQTIVFYDTVEETDTEGETLYPVRDSAYYNYVTDFLRALKESGYHTQANAVILTEKFDVTLIYAEKFKIRFGDVTNSDVKFRVLYEIFAEGSMQYVDKASIDISNPSVPTARPDITLDFSQYID